MLVLDKIQSNLDLELRSIGVADTPLAQLGNSKAYKIMLKKFYSALSEQIEKVVDSGLFELIHSKISKADVIFTESDEIEIYDSVKEELAKNPISDYLSDLLVAGYLITVFEKGGQDFLNRHNLPANFVLRNEEIKTIIKARPAKLFSGMDETTSKWISDHIVTGKKTGMATKEIIDEIVSKFPEYPAFRAETIVRTESSNMLGESEQLTAQKNGASHKTWVTAGDNRVSKECQANERAGTIGINANFPTGAFTPPQHPNCRCVLDYHFTPFMGFIWSGQ